jgi:hypothetical protein
VPRYQVGEPATPKADSTLDRIRSSRYSTIT